MAAPSAVALTALSTLECQVKPFLVKGIRVDLISLNLLSQNSITN